MWQFIKNIFIEPNTIGGMARTEYTSVPENIGTLSWQDMANAYGDIIKYDSVAIHTCEAEDYYCALCKRGFKTKAARNSHRSFKHKHA